MKASLMAANAYLSLAESAAAGRSSDTYIAKLAKALEDAHGRIIA